MEAATNFSGFYMTNQTYDFTPEPDYSKPDERDDEMALFNYIERLVKIISYPIIVVGGTVGNILTFIVMRRGSLREVSTCYYMSILALADTGKSTIIFSLILFIAFLTRMHSNRMRTTRSSSCRRVSINPSPGSRHPLRDQAAPTPQSRQPP